MESTAWDKIEFLYWTFPPLSRFQYFYVQEVKYFFKLWQNFVFLRGMYRNVNHTVFTHKITTQVFVFIFSHLPEWPPLLGLFVDEANHPLYFLLNTVQLAYDRSVLVLEGTTTPPNMFLAISICLNMLMDFLKGMSNSKICM